MSESERKYAPMNATFGDRRVFACGGLSVTQLLDALRVSGCKISPLAQELLQCEGFPQSMSRYELCLCGEQLIDIYTLTMGVVGDNEARFVSDINTTTEGVRERIETIGFEKCPIDAIPYIRLQFTDQAPGGFFWIPSDPVRGSGGDPHVFCVFTNLDGERWLDARPAADVYIWSPQSTIVFAVGPNSPIAVAATMSVFAPIEATHIAA